LPWVKISLVASNMVAAQRGDEHVGYRGEPEAALVRAHGLGAGAVCKEIEL
jgi:hypothetical protein